MQDRNTTASKNRSLVFDEQIAQEREYRFPYHWIPQWDDIGFRHHVVMDWAYEYVAYASFVIEVVKSLKPRSVLDVGCGDGRISFEMNRALNDSRIVGLDYSENAINLARAMAPRITWLCGDISTIRLEERFDVATLVEVLEHIPPQRLGSFLTGVGQSLRPGGYVVVSVPSSNIPVTEKHFHHFSEESARSLMSQRFAVRRVWHLNKEPGRVFRAVIRSISNSWIFVVHPGILRRFFAYYKRGLLETTEEKGRRLVLLCESTE